MTASTTIVGNGTKTRAKVKPRLTSKLETIEVAELKPLPHNRPIASNTSTGIAEMLGYLD